MNYEGRKVLPLATEGISFHTWWKMTSPISFELMYTPDDPDNTSKLLGAPNLLVWGGLSFFGKPKQFPVKLRG